MPDNFSTDFSDEDLYLLLTLGKKYGFDPLSSAECEKYFMNLLQKYDESQGSKRSFLENIISKSFISCEEKPSWVQNADWQFADGKPMFFVGQKEIAITKNHIIFHYIFYIFWDMDTGNVKTIIQSE